MHTTPVMPRFAFADGALSVETTLSTMRIRWNPTPAAEERLAFETTWKPFAPEFRLLQPPPIAPVTPDPSSPTFEDMAELKRLAFAAFRAELPANLPPLAERFPCHQWALLALLHESHSCVDLAVSNPILAWCLANHHHFRERTSKNPLLQAAFHSHQKQREILEWLGFPGTEATVRLLRKIPPEAAAPTLLNGLRLALAQPASIPPFYRHLTALNAGILALIGNPPVYPLLTQRLLEEVAASPDELEYPQTACRLHEVGLLFKAARVPCPATPLRAIAQVECLRQAGERAYQDHERRKAEQAEAERRAAEQARLAARTQADVERARRRALVRAARSGRKPFPPPPIPGTDSIIPLTSVAALTEEGREQKNCVSTYAAHVIEGFQYIYRVLAPERATLAIRRWPDGSWRRSQIQGTRHTILHAKTIRQVDQWLAAHRISV